MRTGPRFAEYLFPLLAVAFALLALVVGGVLTTVLAFIFHARRPEIEEVHGFRLFHRSRIERAVSPAQIWIRLERTLAVGWIARAWLLGACVLGLVVAAYLHRTGDPLAALIIGAGALLFLPVVVMVWDSGRDLYLIADKGQGVLFRKELRTFRFYPAEAFMLRDLRRIVLRQEASPLRQRPSDIGFEESDRSLELWRVPLNWILQLEARSGEAKPLLVTLNYHFLHHLAVALSDATGLPLVEIEEGNAAASPRGPEPN